MGSVISIDQKDLPAALKRGEKRMRRAIAAGALAGAHRGRAVIVKRTPVDMGPLKAAWRVRPGTKEFSTPDATLAELINDSPYIAAVELGSRPHGVSADGWAAIYEWVRRHFRGGQLGGKGRMRSRSAVLAPLRPYHGDDPVITAVTNAIVARMRKVGTKATLFVRNSIDELRTVMAYELERAIATVDAALAKGEG